VLKVFYITSFVDLLIYISSLFGNIFTPWQLLWLKRECQHHPLRNQCLLPPASSCSCQWISDIVSAPSPALGAAPGESGSFTGPILVLTISNLPFCSLLRHFILFCWLFSLPARQTPWRRTCWDGSGEEGFSEQIAWKLFASPAKKLVPLCLPVLLSMFWKITGSSRGLSAVVLSTFRWFCYTLRFQSSRTPKMIFDNSSAWLFWTQHPCTRSALPISGRCRLPRFRTHHPPKWGLWLSRTAWDISALSYPCIELCHRLPSVEQLP